MIMYQNVIGIKKLITLFTRDCLRFAQQRIYYFPVPVMYLTEAVRRAQDILFPSKPRDAMDAPLSFSCNVRQAARTRGPLGKIY